VDKLQRVQLATAKGQSLNIERDVSMSAVIDKLNEILRHEWTGVAQYAQAGFLVSGLWRQVYSDMFFESAQESFAHARLVGEKISALGGVPTVERKPVKQSNDVVEMLKFGLEFESTAVKLYTEALHLCEGDRALVVFLEDILKQEQEGVDEITKLLRDHQVAASGSGTTATKAG
jgi:bacterioferritin